MSIDIEDLIFNLVKKPKNFYMTRVNNVYSNKYRINIYCEEDHDGLRKRKICASYFCSLSPDNQLDIIHGNPLPNGASS